MNTRVEQTFGRFFEDFEVGMVYAHWPGRTVTAYDNVAFSLLTQNQHPLHIDVAYAEGTRFGRPLVIGVLVMAIAVGQSVADISGKAVANLGYDAVRHLRPTFHGDTLYSETEILDKRLSSKDPRNGVVHVETRTRNQHGEQVLSLRRHVLVPTRQADSGGQS